MDALINLVRSVNPAGALTLEVLRTCSNYSYSLADGDNCNAMNGAQPTATPGADGCFAYIGGRCEQDRIIPAGRRVYGNDAATQANGQTLIENINIITFLRCPGGEGALRSVLCGAVAPECVDESGRGTGPFSARPLCRSVCERANADCPEFLDYFLEANQTTAYAFLGGLLTCSNYPEDGNSTVECDKGGFILPLPEAPPVATPPPELGVQHLSVRLVARGSSAEAIFLVTGPGDDAPGCDSVKVEGYWDFSDGTKRAVVQGTTSCGGWIKAELEVGDKLVKQFCVRSLQLRGQSSSSISVCMEARARPNVIVMLIDDMGYGDVGVFHPDGAGDTPRLDDMARRGIQFTQWLSAAPICTPSRAALLTGRLPLRSGMDDAVYRALIHPGIGGGMPREEVTLAERLRDYGYRTLIYGKWHLGVNEKFPGDSYYLPTNQGFDSWFGVPLSNAPWCSVPGVYPASDMCQNMQDTVVVEQPMELSNSTGRLTQQAIWAIDEATTTHRPFFLYLSYLHIHTALFCQDRFKGTSARGEIGDNVREVDWSVGQILDHLQRTGLEEDTLVFFTSDNGPYLEEGAASGSSGGLRGGKGQIWEGGIRVPGIAYWPGTVPPAQVYTQPVSTLDIFPTVLSLAGIPPPLDRIIDGKDISPILINGARQPSPHVSMFHYCGENLAAVRTAKFKVVYQAPVWTDPASQSCPYDPAIGAGTCGCAGNEIIELNPPQIFDMDADPVEQNPLTPANFVDYAAVLASADAAKAAHRATMVPGENQMSKLYNPILQPCCPGQDQLSNNCNCAYNFPTSAPTPPEAEKMTPKGKDSSVDGGTVAAAVIIPIGIAALTVGAIIYHRRTVRNHYEELRST
eukprot:TRINITY_DN3478_c0_g1_i1.p1 TRINITY_DN3478_c0_g1~~TRINITY_DN3478_c0_g1_i1.p1  ORF type:complete len:987 (-),score=177.56 TRINITY_DN3478_c0_g1_i1:58-2631(-)